MAMTLIEFAKTTQDPLQRGVVKTFAESSPIFEFLPFVDIPGNSWTYNEESVLPGVAFRALNAAYSESVGVIVPRTEKIKILGGDADTDRMFEKWGASAVLDRRAYDLEAKSRAIARYFDKIFIDGDEGTTPTQFDGLNVRCASSQHLHADAGTGTAGANLTENLLQCLADKVDGGPNLFLMGKKVYRNLASLLRAPPFSRSATRTCSATDPLSTTASASASSTRTTRATRSSRWMRPRVPPAAFAAPSTLSTWRLGRASAASRTTPSRYAIWANCKHNPSFGRGSSGR
jgi:hypothetical protein